ncbi:MAG: EamA family transporter [Paracoccaceae bacterium]
MSLIAVIFGLLSGFFFGLTSHVQKSALAGTEVAMGAFLSVATMAGLLWLVAPFLIDPAWIFTGAALIFAACGLIFPAASQPLQVASVVKVGPALTSGIGSFAPLFAVTLAVMFLGEDLNTQGVLGIALMLAGLLLSALAPGAGIARGFPIWALLLPLGASAARGVVQPLTKYGFAEVNSAYFATLVMATVSTVILGIWLLSIRARRPLRTTRQGNQLFLVNGFVIGGGILSLQISISYGAVSLAAPLSSTTPLWTLLLGVLFFRNEKLTVRHLIMSLLVVAGVTLVVTR